MSIEIFVTLVALFGSVALLVALGLSRAFSLVSPERRRLQVAAHSGESGVLIDTSLLAKRPDRLADRLSKLVPRSPKEASRLRRRMIRAGYHTNAPLALYTAGQITLVALGGVIPYFFAPMRPVWPLMLIGAFLGYQLPSLLLSRQVAMRQKVIRNGLPDALDLMIVCLESGSAIDQTIAKVAEELQLAYPALAEEFRMVGTETRAGKPRIEAFKNLSERTGVDEVRSLVAMLVQTDRFGTSVSQALRTHADMARTKRRQRAEENAAKIGVKLAFPLVFCLFPAFFIVTLGPAVIQFIRVFQTQINN